MKNYTITQKTHFNPLKVYSSAERKYYVIEDNSGNELYNLKWSHYYLSAGSKYLSGNKDIEISDSDQNKIGTIYDFDNRKEVVINGNSIDYYCELTDRSYIKPTNHFFFTGMMNGFRALAHSKDEKVFGLKNRHWTSGNGNVYDASKNVIATYSFNKGGFLSKESYDISLKRELSQKDFFLFYFLYLCGKTKLKISIEIQDKKVLDRFCQQNSRPKLSSGCTF